MVDEHLRRSIVDVLADPHQGQLLLWALHDMQRRDWRTDPLSYFQLAAMHGMPRLRWDGVRRPGELYCGLDSARFLLWNRAFLRLFEQEVVRTASRAAVELEKFRSDRRFIAAAASLRLPFWDPIGHPGPVPQAMVEATVVLGSTTTTTTIDSPLLKLTFPCDVAASHGGVIARAGAATTRGVDSDGVTFIGRLDGARPRLSTLAERFMKASNTDEAVAIIASLHKQVCRVIGGSGGTMSVEDFALAAFDPVFFLHLCNMERLHAEWQRTHGDNPLCMPRVGAFKFCSVWATFKLVALRVTGTLCDGIGVFVRTIATLELKRRCRSDLLQTNSGRFLSWTPEQYFARSMRLGPLRCQWRRCVRCGMLESVQHPSSSLSVRWSRRLRPA